MNNNQYHNNISNYNNYSNLNTNNNVLSTNNQDIFKDIANKSVKNYTRKRVQKNFLERLGSAMDKLSKCNFDFIKRHFDVTEYVVRMRILHSLVPFNPRFHTISKEKPDLYGPLWIFTTLVFIIAASGEIAGYLNGALETNYFEQFVPLSALMIYGIGLGLPSLIWIVMKLFGSHPSLILLLCIYGYSFSSYIPISLLCTIPSTNVHIISIGWGVFVSTSFLLVNIWQDLSSYVSSRKYFLIGIIVIFQMTLYLCMVLYFFGMGEKIEEIKHIVYDNAVKSTNSIMNKNSNSTMNIQDP